MCGITICTQKACILTLDPIYGYVQGQPKNSSKI